MKRDFSNIVSLFLQAADKYPDRTAIIEGETAVTYRTLLKQVKSAAAYFRSKGIGPEDRVLVFVPMSIRLYRTVLALFYIGATAVFIDDWANRKRLEACCKMAGCKGFISTFKTSLLWLYSGEIRQIPIRLNANKTRNEDIGAYRANPESTALITFTTGSTGMPKAASRSHAFLSAQFSALLDEIKPQPADVDMPVLPIVLFANLGVGCTSVIAKTNAANPRRMNVGAIVRQIKRHRVNRITASPSFVQKLASFASPESMEYEQIEKVFTGGAPVFPSDAAALIEAFPNAVVKVVYGSTEAEPISSIDARELVARSFELAKGLPVGRSYHRAKVIVIPADRKIEHLYTTSAFEALKLGDRQIGEVIVAGPHVLDRYFRNDEAFRKNKIIVDGVPWHRTGDSGFMNGDQLYLTGRCRQLISTDQGYLSPFIIENLLQQKEGIEAGTLLQHNGQLVLVVQSDMTKKVLEPRLADIPHDQVVIMREIPRDPRHHSKIDYDRLRHLID